MYNKSLVCNVIRYQLLVVRGLRLEMNSELLISLHKLNANNFTFFKTELGVKSTLDIGYSFNNYM